MNHEIAPFSRSGGEASGPADENAPTAHTAAAVQWVDAVDSLLADPVLVEDFAGLEDSVLVDVISRLEKMKGTVAAAQAQAETEFYGSQLELQERQGVQRKDLGRGIGDQIALARRITPKRASEELTLNRILTSTLPRTLDLLSRGEISDWTAREMAKNVLVLDDADRADIDAELAERLPEVTPRHAGKLARAMADRIDPEAAVHRNSRAVANRHVSLAPAPDGMSILRAVLPVQAGVATVKALADAAASAKAAGDERSRGQLMSDTLVERATGISSVEDIGVEIALLMTDYTLLAGQSETAWIDGHPIPGLVARHLALGAPADTDTGADSDAESSAMFSTPRSGAPPREDLPSGHDPPPGEGFAPDPQPTSGKVSSKRWIRRLYTDPVTQELKYMDPRRRPFVGNARRFVLHRDQTCRTPWCDSPIRHTDHIVRAADGGPTAPENGAGVCERFNYVVEMPGWNKATLTDPTKGRDVLAITTPTGHRYSSLPPALRMPTRRRRRPDNPSSGQGAAEEPGPQPPDTGSPDTGSSAA